jgi:hypothetical protein
MRKNKTPIRFTLYDPQTGEVREEFATYIIPTGILEIALQLQNIANPKDLKPDEAIAIQQLIVDLFGGRFSLKDVQRYSELEEAWAVIVSMGSRLGDIHIENPNPTQPG